MDKLKKRKAIQKKVFLAAEEISSSQCEIHPPVLQESGFQ